MDSGTMTQLLYDSVLSTQMTTNVTIILAKSNMYVSDTAREITSDAYNLILSPILCLFGITANLINITVFIKSGFSNSTNIALLGLSLSDLFILLALLWENFCYFPLFLYADLPFDPLDTAYVTGGIPLTFFGRTTSWITGFITLERYLCVAFPLKVKTLSTPRKSTIVVVCIYLLMAATVVPMFYVSRVGLKFYPDRNASRLGLVLASDRYYVNKYVFPFTNILVQIGSFAFVFLFTVLLFIKLKRNNKWREHVTNKGGELSRRDQKVAIMVVVISSNFIICYSGITVVYIVPMFVEGFTTRLAYRNLFIVFNTFALLTKQINASTNVFIYLKMSSKYRRVFHSVCLCAATEGATSV